MPLKTKHQIKNTYKKVKEELNKEKGQRLITDLKLKVEPETKKWFKLVYGGYADE
jgi:hypothetical protein